MEKQGRHPRVRMAKKLVQDRYKNRRARRKSSLIRKNAEMVVKQERREGASDAVRIMLDDWMAADELEAKVMNWSML